MKKTLKIFFLLTFIFSLWLGHAACTPIIAYAQDTELEKKARFEQILEESNPEEALKNALHHAVRAGRKQDVEAKAKIVELLGEVRKGTLDPEGFYQKVSIMDMPPGKELRHVLMEVKKDVGNYLGKKGLEKIFGFVHKSGGTSVEAEILTHRKKVVMETVKKAIVVYRDRVKAVTGDYPKFSFYYGEVGGWPTETFDELKFAGDIDFNFLCGDLDAARDLKMIFDEMIRKRFHGRTPEEIDIPCTVHGMATAEVYVGKHGQAFAEEVTKVAWEIDFENAGEDMDLKAKEVPFKNVLEHMVLEARLNKVNNAIDDLQTLKWPYQPGISLEMIRHFEHDIAGKNVFTDLESFVKAAKYTDRSFDFLVKELKGGPVAFDERLSEFVTELTENKKNPKKQVDLIKEYFKDIGKPIPFEVNLEITAEGKSRATIEANDKFIKEFWDICRQSMWDGANQVLKKKTQDLKKRIKALGENDLEESKAIYEELVKLDEMLEIEDRILKDKVAGVHDLDPEYMKNMEEFRKQRNKYKQKSAKFGHVEYIDPKLGKSYAWIETMLKMGKEFNIKMAGAALLSAPGKFNDVLDFIDDGLMTKLRNGGGDEYIKILRKGQGLYWDERANKLLKGTRFERRFDTQFKSMEKQYGQKVANINKWMNDRLAAKLSSRGLKGMQTINSTFSESVSSSRAGGAMMSGMMLYSLKDELPLYYNYIGERDFYGLATEFFKRRVPFGGAVERYVMEDTYGVLWEMTATLIPPVGILSAAKALGEYTVETGIETVWTESLESFIDNLYENAEFKIASVETVNENIKISEWELLNVTYKSKKYRIYDLIAMETSDAREMAACLQKTSAERPECFPMDKISNGLFEWWGAKDAFEHKFEKTDAWLQLIAEMAKDKNVGEKLKDHFQYQRYARLEQIKVEFLKRLKQKLEERRAGEQSLISGNFPKAYDELLQIGEQLDIRPQIEKEISDKFGGGIMQFMTSLKDMLRGAARDLRGNVDVWDVYEELSAFVTKNLRTYKRILEGREFAESKLVLKKHDQGLRILTGPYFLTGVPTEDASSSEKWFGHIDQITEKNINSLRSIKAEVKADPVELDLSDGAYDQETLNRLVYHQSFKDMWKQVNSRNLETIIPSYLGEASSKQQEPNDEGIMSDQDRAQKRFAVHEQRIEATLNEFRAHYGSRSGDEKAHGNKGAEQDSAFDSLQGLKRKITSLGDQIAAISEQVKGLVNRIKSIEDYIAEQTTTIKAQLDQLGTLDAANAQGMPFDDSVLNESGDIDFLSKLVSTLRADIENETLAVCQQYEKLQEATKINNMEHFMEEAKSAFGSVTEKYEESSQIQHKLNPAKERAQQTLSKIVSAENIVIDQAKLNEIEASLAALKQTISSVDSIFKAVKDHAENGEGLKAQAAVIIEKLKGYDPVLISEKNKNVPGEIQGVYGQINTHSQQIMAASSNIGEGPVNHSEQTAGLEAHLKSLQIAAQSQETATGRSFAESEEALKSIVAQIDAAQLFYPPIEEAHKNAEICLEASEKVFKQKTSPEAQLGKADCSSFKGTKAQWDEYEQTVVCNCPEGIDWDEAKKKCVDNSSAGQLARADCSSFKGTKPEWNEEAQAVDCNCPKELDWSEKYNECIDNSPEGQVARLDCSKYPGTYAKWDYEEKRPKCYCPDGLDWSKKDNQCIDNSPEARVARTKCKYSNSEPYWDEEDEKVYCDCKANYEWNNAETGCRLRSDIQVANASCKPGLHPGWSEKHEDVRCYCDDGYWSSSEKRCISEREQESARRERQREEEERNRRWEQEQRRREAEEEAERQQHCLEALQKLNDASLGSDDESEWQQVLNFSSAHNADCDSSEINAAKQGRWRPSRSKYRPKGSRDSSPNRSNDDIIIFTDDLPSNDSDWNCHQGIMGMRGDCE